MYTYSQNPDCSVYNSSLFNDLREYSFESESTTDNNGTIIYQPVREGPSTEETSYDVTLRIDKLNDIIETNVATALGEDIDILNNVWYPAFITTSESDQSKKAIHEQIDFKEDSLGINNFITFVGKFNFWKTFDVNGESEVDRLMVSDWKLTNKYNNFSPLYGTLCWYRKNLGTYIAKFRYLPVGTTFSPIGSENEEEIYVKTDTFTAKNTSVDRSVLGSSLDVNNPPEFNFTDDEELYNMGPSGDISYQIFRAGPGFAPNVDLGSEGIIDAIHISDGESFAFYDNAVDAARAQASSLFSYSYVSPALHGTYREIFNALYPYARGHTMTENKARAFNLLCNFMSTAPQIDRVTVNSLSDGRIKTTVLDFLDNLQGGDAEQEKLQVFKCIYNIMNITNDSVYDQVPGNIALENNITNKKGLFNKIISKYTPELTLVPGEDTVLRYVDPEGAQNPRSTSVDGSNGIHLMFNNIATTYYDETNSNQIQQNLDGTTSALDSISAEIESLLAADAGVPASMYTQKNSLTDKKDQLASDLEASMLLFNNYGIYLGNDTEQYMRYQTDFSPTQSQAYINAFQAGSVDKVAQHTLFYADYELPALSEETLYLGGGYYTPNIAVTFGRALGSRNVIFPDVWLENDVFGFDHRDTRYNWRVRKGPGGLSFADFSYPHNTYATSTAADPSLGIRATGTWEIELTRTIGLFSQVDRTIISSESSSHLLPAANVSSNPINFRRMNCGFANTLAFDKSGLVWLVDTSNFIRVKDFRVIEGDNDECLRAKDIRLFIRDNDTEKKVFDNSQQTSVENTYLDLTYKPGNTTISIFALNISYLRDETNPYCTSSYNDQIYQKRGLSFGGTVNFYRNDNRYTSAYCRDITSDEIIDGIRQIRYGEYYNCANKYYEEGQIRTYKTQANNPNYAGAPFGEEGVDYTEFYWDKGDPYYSSIPGEIYDVFRHERDYFGNKEGTVVPVSGYGGFSEEQLTQILGSTRIPDHTHDKLESLEARNNVFDPTGIFCYREILPITGNEITLSKGLFDPAKGFVYPDDDSFVDNKSYVLEDRTEKYSTHLLEGKGFFDLRPYNITNSDNLHSHRSCIYINSYKSTDLRRETSSLGYKGNNTTDNGVEPGRPSMYLIGESTYSGYDEDFETGDLLESYEFYEDDSLNSEIKHVEVNLNHLNYQNPQNLIFTLEMYDANGDKYEHSFDTMSTAPSDDVDAKIQDYYNALRDLHTTGEVCLLNQEHVKNYHPNYIFRFSDFYDKNVVGSTRETFSGSGMQRTHLNLSDYNNEERMNPTAFVDSSGAETESLGDVHMVNATKNNNIGGFFTHLDKFAKEKIGGITAKLAVCVVNDFDYRIDIMDNLLSNNMLANLETLQNRTTSNNINNSLCTWELILHKDDIPGYHRKDTLGQIAYDKRTSVENDQGPFNYIFDAGPEKAMIPNININAPYQYIQGVTDCRYLEEIAETMKPNYSIMPEFPSLLSTNLVRNASWGGLGIFGMAALGYAHIIGYFYAVPLLDRRSAINRSYFTPAYTYQGFGKSDRAVVCLSNNKSSWYATEVPIFKYQNTTEAYPQELIYVLSHKANRFAGIGRFSYSILNNYRQLDLINCKYVLETDMSDNDGYLIGEKLDYNYVYASTLDGSTHEKKINLFVGDIVKLNNQPILENDGYWLVQHDNWISFPSMNYVFMQNHKIDVSSDTDWYNGKFIIMDGSRAYYHFDVGKTVLLAKDISNTITSSNLISTNSGYKTILGFSNPVVGEGEMGYSADSSNRILVFNPKYQTSKQDLSSKTNSWVEDFNFIYKWPMEEHKKGLNTHTHDAVNTATPEGNIGYGTDVIRHGILHTEQKINKSFNIHDQANNKNNDDYKYFNFSLKHKAPSIEEETGNIATYEDGGYVLEEKTSDLTFSPDDSVGDKMRAYRYSIKDLGIYSGHGQSQQLDLLDSADGVDTITAKTLDDDYKSSYFVVQDLYGEDFIEIATDKIMNINQETFTNSESPGSFSLSDSGILNIYKDLNYNNKVVAFTETVYNNMKEHYEDIISNTEGVVTTFEEAKLSNNLTALRNYLDTLPQDDIECQTPEYYSSDNCPKVYIQQRIHNKENEANDIFHAMDIAYTGGLITPHITGVFDVNETNDSSISYGETDYYWIHIDPENGCRIADEVSVKIPTASELFALNEEAAPPFNTMLSTYSQITPAKKNLGIEGVIGQDFVAPAAEGGFIHSTDELGGNFRVDYTEIKQQQIKDAWLQVDPNLDFSDMNEIVLGTKEFDGFDQNKMVINYGNKRDGVLFCFRDFYERPTNMAGQGQYSKLKDVIDFSQPVYMKFRIMPPRKIRYHDQNYSSYQANEEGELQLNIKKNIYTAEGSRVYNDFYCWRCVDQDSQYTETPAFLKMLNEMIFRGFFGSTDGVEQTNQTVLECQEAWSWIPYDYK
tara:strand:+ start:15457 stop:22701 length:7245 start_codon:yes stop_codon:yes gene_type:complete